MRIEKTEQGKTKNGLRYYLFPRTGFGEQMAAVLVQRGANHLFWKGRDGEKICFPQGTAHFIEHKLFQQEWGDAFARFTQNGASANAFTDGDRTVYYFTCSDKFTENLRLLLDFVQKPYFTKEDTEREKDIIVSEITMYEDDPMWVGYYQMLEGMDGKHPIRNRIAGTAETVAEITEETLQRAYACYYTTDEMALICAGDIHLGEVRRMAERVARRETDARVYFPTEDAEIAEKYRACERRLSVPQFQIGCKLPPLPKQDWLKKRMAAGFCMELLAGESSVFFQKAYEWESWMRHSALPFSAARGMPLRHFRAVGRIRRKQRIFWEGSWSACNKKAFRRRIFSVSAKSTWGSSCGSWIHRRSSALDSLRGRGWMQRQSTF